MARAEKIPVAPWRLGPARLAQFRKKLVEWFQSSKRDLPWRNSRDAYRIWISEIMLQQTRVAAVIPYYERFLSQFPNVEALANARIETVLRFWAGLGYYSRARNVHKAARQISDEHGGVFPREKDQALALAGIGKYTAAAVLSIAYGAPFAVLDGNVARVLARLGAIRGDLRAPERWSSLSETAQTLLDGRIAGDWNQAMMELGATVCTPRAPDCRHCPVAKFCQARALGIEDELPAKRVKRATEKVTLCAAIFVDDRGRTLLIHPRRKTRAADAGPSNSSLTNSAHALFSNLWQFPAIETRNGENGGAAKSLGVHVSKLILETGGRAGKISAANFIALPRARHNVTYRDISLVPYLMRVETLPQISAARVIALRSIDRLAVSGATRKIAATALRAFEPAK